MISATTPLRWFGDRDELDVLEAWRVVAVLVALSIVVGPWAVIDEVPASAALVIALVAAYAEVTLAGAYVRRRYPARRWAVLTLLLVVDGIGVAALISLGDESTRRGLPLMLVEIAILAAMGPTRTALKAALWSMLCLTAVAALLDPPPRFAASGGSFALLLGSFVAPIVVVVAARHALRPLAGRVDREVPRPRGRGRALAYATVGAFALVAPVTTALAPPALRATVAFIAMMLAPGMVLTSWMRLRDPLDELVLAVVASITITILCTQAMLAMSWWHPKALSAATAVAGLVLLRQAWQARPIDWPTRTSPVSPRATRAIEAEGASA